MHPMRQDTTDLAQMRHLEKAGGWTRRERLRCLWYRLRLIVQEMNYATRRIVELQAPWISDRNSPPSGNCDGHALSSVWRKWDGKRYRLQDQPRGW
jgi:hypothetical protein